MHYPWDGSDGLALGERIAGQVLTTKLTPLPSTPLKAPAR